MEWIKDHWIDIMAIVWSLDQILKIVAKMTANKVDDNISDMIGNILTKFFPKK